LDDLLMGFVREFYFVIEDKKIEANTIPGQS